MSDSDSLIPKHGGYRNLKSFQIGQLVYDVTVRFCDRYIEKRSRTHDQMVQAARSGVQNIAEGSQASGTSKKFEIKLTNVARASLEELRLDYEDFLRQRGLPKLEPDHPVLRRFKAKRCASLDEVRGWVVEERGRHTDEQGRTRTNTDLPQAGSVPVGDSPCRAVCLSLQPPSSPCLPESALVTNAALSLLNLCCYLLDRQVAAQAAAFEKDGGFTERLYRIRCQTRKKP